jgi:hypothetical protein
MKFAKINLFVAWFLIPQTLAMGWVAFAGRMVLELFGVSTHEEGIPGRIVGAVLLLGVVFLVQHLRGGVLGPVGNPAGKDYRFGQRMVLAANILAALLFVFPFVWQLIQNRDVVMVLSKFAIAFGYWVMAMWSIGFSFIYQSSLPGKVTQ